MPGHIIICRHGENTDITIHIKKGFSGDWKYVKGNKMKLA